MTYNIKHANTSIPDYTVYDNTTNTDTSLKFPGRFVAGYSQTIAENFLHLLENFASDSEPSSPQIGQLWYDTASGYLRVHSGTGSTVAARWKAASGIEYNSENPGTAVAGQLWVDTANRQLNIYTGSSWMVVGPTISTRDGLKNGALTEDVMDTSNTLRSIIKIYIADVPVAIISKDSFQPKAGIAGYGKINSGVNLNTPVTTLDKTNFYGGYPQFSGTATAATQLIVGNAAVDSNKFLRTDTINNTEYAINIKHNDGLAIGTDRNLIISYNSTSKAAKLYNSTEGSIELQSSIDHIPTTVLKVTGTTVGINTAHPSAELDVTGNAKVSGKITITGTNGIALDVTGKVSKGLIVDQTQKDSVLPTDQVLLYRDGDYLSKTTIKSLLSGVQGDGTKLVAATAYVLGGVIIPAITTSGIKNTDGTIGIATASTTQLGGVIIPAITTSGIKNTNGTIGIATASTTQLGGVIIPAIATSGIKNTNGTIGIATASTTQLGGVMVDGSTITITDGVISSTGGSGGGGSGLSSRTIKTATTASIANGVRTNLTIVGAKGYCLYSIQTSAAAWVTVYTSTTARTSDTSRTITTDPIPGGGVIAEVITTGAQTQILSPAVVGFNSESPPNTNIQLAVENRSGTTQAITVTLVLVQLEV